MKRFLTCGMGVLLLIGLLSVRTPAVTFVQGALAQESCALIQPLKIVGGVQWYADKAGSIVDPQKRREHERALKPLYDLMRQVSEAADREIEKMTTDGIRCARENLGRWAADGALLARPSWGFALAEQTIAVTGLNIIALKFKLASDPLPQNVLEWIGQATNVVVQTYENGAQRGNLYTWSGVAAAANDLLTHKRNYSLYHQRVWQYSINKINPDGTVIEELNRKGRALIYHNYFRGALFMLKRIRDRLELQATENQNAALKRLSDLVNANVCNSSNIDRLAGAPQEKFGRWEAAIGTYFAQVHTDSNWTRCTRTEPTFTGPTYGGRFDLTSRMLDSIQ